ncbi:diguanylate cyclase [Vibrio ziniensis]|uniref:Sensor domain-containing diguanylate cyclase n=1 Tax=Vibrio ziniensis TaxID=2711221 RepID=A0A6G7CP73_9VIBR|nr:diguanylate cyclase [Vibrio ziniensis]QIH43853.1 sensor domain-containing diguanylate cyclase [Vibrio ziniensis]
MGVISGKLWIVRILLLTFLLIFIGLIESFNISQRNFMREGLYTRAKEELLSIRFRLEASILSDIYAANGLQALVTARPSTNFEDWPQIAASVLRKGKHLQVLGLAPNDIIKYIYPLESNQAALGLDYRTVPIQWASVTKAREIQEIFISGPVDLVQGGRALVARVPIFTDPPMNKNYWGVFSIIINWDSLFSASGVETFSYSYNFAIRGFDSSGEQGAVFFGEQSTFENAFATEDVHFPYGSWVIAASEKRDLLKQLPWYQSNIVRLQGYPILLVLMLMAFIIYRLYTVANERAMFDELTKLPNRRYFIFTLQHFFELAEKSKGKNSFAILNIDLDKFKSINDKYGHDAGDKVLIACSERIRSVLRASDIVSRMGGDEFLILLPRINRISDLENISKSVEKAISDTPVIYEKKLFNIHASVGYTLYQSKYVDIDDMLKAADEAMYVVKHGLA